MLSLTNAKGHTLQGLPADSASHSVSLVCSWAKLFLVPAGRE